MYWCLGAALKGIKDVLALRLLKGEFAEGQTVAVDAKDGGLAIAAINAPDVVEAAESPGPTRHNKS